METYEQPFPSDAGELQNSNSNVDVKKRWVKWTGFVVKLPTYNLNIGATLMLLPQPQT